LRLIVVVERTSSRKIAAMPSSASRPAESDLYPAVKAFLEAQGYTVKSEIRGCDVVALRGDEPPVIVELKLTFSLALLLQGIDRLSLTDRVYLAVSRPRGRQAKGVSVYRREVRDLCRRVGLGLLTVAPGRSAAAVEVVADPIPYRPRRRTKELTRLLGEHARRTGDPNRGGVTRTPIVTAYRQEALRCALLIRQDGRANIKMLRETERCSLVVCMSHLGYYENPRRGSVGDSQVAGQVDGIDFIASGHSHLFMQQPVKQKQPCGAETLIFQVGKSGIYVGRVDFTFRVGKLVSLAGRLLDMRSEA